MSLPITSRSLRILLLIVFVIGCAGLAQQASHTSAHPTVGAPLRLRLKVEHTSLSERTTINIWADFLDGDYDPVPSDGTRIVKFEIVQPRAVSGSISPPEFTVKPGERSAFAKFTSGQPGRVLIRASSIGLDSDETFVLITPKAASFLTQILGMFETVAYAAPPRLKFLPSSVNTEARSRAKFQLDFGSAPAGTEIKISTEPPAKIIEIIDEKDKDHGCEMNMTAGQNGRFSKEIYITSPDDREVKVLADAHGGSQASALITFTKRRPSKVYFIDGLKEIASNRTEVVMSIQLGDRNENLFKSDQKRTIILKPGNRDVEFEPKSVQFLPDQESASTTILLKGLPSGKELAVLAESSGDNKLEPGWRSIFIRNPAEKLEVTGQSPVKRGNRNAEFTVQLLDKDNKPTTTDKDRTVNLSVTDGRLIQTQVTILKNQDSARVQYVPSFASGKVVLKAQSDSLTEGSKEIVLVTPLWWLVLAALGGSLIGGIARYLPKGDGLGEYVPFFKRGSKSFAVNILGSLVSGFIFFLAMKLGLSGALGFTLPASFDVGMGLAAFLLACIGGYMGIGKVFDGIASLWGRFTAKKESPAPVASGIDQGARP